MSELKVNTISEVTGANGVVVDSVKLKDGGVIIADAANIGSASDTDALAISSGGVVTFTQVPLLPDNTIETADIQADAITGAKIADDAINSEHYTDGSIDTAHLADAQITTAKLSTAVFTGATDIGAAIVDADLFLMDDGAGGTIRKTTAARIKTYAGVSGDVTTIDSLLKADIKIGEDDQTKIDFETADEIQFYAANVNQVKLIDNAFSPVADSDVDLGTSSLYFKDAYIDTITTTGSISAKGGLVVNEDKGNVDFRVESDDKSHLFFTDASANVCGTSLEDGTAPQHGQFHIRNSSSGQSSMPANGDELIIEGNGHMGMTILSAAANTGNIFFGDSGDNDIGSLIYNHNDNSMSLTTNTAVGLKIDSTGAVTKPLQPAFSATTNATQTNLTEDADNTIVFGLEIFDTNADFASNTFTAPVAGKYMLSAKMVVAQIDHDAAYYAAFQIVTSNRDYSVNYSVRDFLEAQPELWTFQVAVVADMDASDTAFVRYRESGPGASQTDVYNADSVGAREQHQFNGYLLG